MKNKFFILILFIMSSYCLLNAEDSFDIFSIEQAMEDTQNQLLQISEETVTEEDVDNSTDIENTMEDAQNQLLEILNDDDGSMDSLDIIQEGNTEVVQKNEEIDEVKRKIAENKKQNDSVSCYTLGFNFPFTYFPDLEYVETSTIPFGFSVGVLSSIEKWSFKANLNWDFINEDLDIISLSGSLGRTPIHNYYFLFGYYFTIGFESANESSIFNIGASGTMAFKFIGNSRLFLNIDALYRRSNTEEVTALDFLLDSWKLCPSIGFVFGY